MPYVVFCKPVQEVRAVVNLERQGYHTFLPLCRLTPRSELGPLFPRYLFLWVPAGLGWLAIGNTMGVSHIIKNSDGTPAEVHDSVIREIRERVESNGGIVLEETERQFEVGQRIDIIGGTHDGMAGLFLSRKKDRITALFSLFGRQVRATVAEKNIA